MFRATKAAGKAIHQFSMAKPDEPVLLGVSGGKDSNFLALALALRTKWLPWKNPLTAVFIDWKEHPISKEEREDLTAYFDLLEIPLETVEASMYPASFKGEFNCYLCSRNRKRILFNAARDKGIRTIALGHHMDDVIETTLINIVTRGYISTMMPVQDFFHGEARIIRPLCLIKEHTIENLCAAFRVPVSQTKCQNKQKNIRAQFKPIIRQLVHLNGHAREHIFNACFNIARDYLPER